MQKVICVVLALMVALMVSALPANADRGRHGGYHSHGGYRGHGGHGGGHFGIGVYFGPGWWDPGWRWPYPYYPYYPVPTVIQQPPTEIYVQPAPQAEEPQYWYYCQEAQGYYPNVERCPKGWLKVIPPANPPE